MMHFYCCEPLGLWYFVLQPLGASIFILRDMGSGVGQDKAPRWAGSDLFPTLETVRGTSPGLAVDVHPLQVFQFPL